MGPVLLYNMSNAGLDSLDHPNRMNLSFFQTMSLTTILILITVPGPAWSQEKESAETALQEAAEQMNNEKAEATSNLRDSVHENLESKRQPKHYSRQLKNRGKLTPPQSRFQSRPVILLPKPNNHLLRNQ